MDVCDCLNQCLVLHHIHYIYIYIFVCKFSTTGTMVAKEDSRKIRVYKEFIIGLTTERLQSNSQTQ